MSTLVIEEGGFLKIDGGASVMIDGVELNPKTIKKDHIALTVEEAKVIANALLTYERLFKGAINASSNSERDSLPLSCNLQKRIEQAEKP